MRTASFVLAAVFAFVLAAVIVSTPRVAHADHNGPWLPSPSAFGVKSATDDFTDWPAQHTARDRGYVTYCLDATTKAYPNFESQARQVADAAQAQTSIPVVEVPYATDGSCDEALTMPSDATFVSTCGAGAAGCIQYWSDPVTIYYRRSLSYTDWRSAQCHEGTGSGHFMGLHEEYNDVAFTSDGKTWTCMDFGTYVWSMPDWDRDRILNCWVPDAPSSVSLTVSNGWARVDWSQYRADNGYAHCDGVASPTAPGIARNTNASVTAFGHSDYDGGPVSWVGDIGCGAAYNYCTSAYTDGSRWFDSYWRGCLYVRAANAATWAIPQVSAPAFWTKAGCY